MLFYAFGGRGGETAILLPCYLAEVTPGFVTPAPLRRAVERWAAGRPVPHGPPGSLHPVPAADLRGPQGAAAGSLRRWISSLSIARRAPQPSCRLVPNSTSQAPSSSSSSSSLYFFFPPFLPPPSLFLRAGLAPPPSGTAGRSAPRPPLNTGGGSAARPSAGWERRGGSRPALQPALQPSGRPPALRHPASHRRRRSAASPLRPRRAPRLPAERPPLPP